MGTQASVIIVAGPTASGKSSFAEELARVHNGEIVNADSVQMFARLSVGTAKPDWRKSDIPHHLFDICSEPRDFDVSSYRSRVLDVVNEIVARGKMPILVGGSLFYIKSLFYPPLVAKQVGTNREQPFPELSNEKAWEKLNEIDSERASKIHANDRYRVDRALLLWQQHGVKPSELQPVFEPTFNATLFYLAPPLETLYERINARTHVMIDDMGWIDEARDAYHDSTWRSFIYEKKFIGYPELFEWIASGEPKKVLPTVIAMIQQETRRYAKRQRTFWRSFCEQLEAEQAASKVCRVIVLVSNDIKEAEIVAL
jgi:tRNA dimethylallyltransferase